jgi:broad specificity phosphatase PhoE
LAPARQKQTLFNRKKLFSGRKNAPLTKKGLHQAQAIGAWFRKNGVVFDAVYASPLARAMRSAGIVCKAARFDPKRIRIERRVIEQDFGFWEGKNSQTIEAVEGPVVSAWFSDRWAVTPRNGENYSDIERRLAPFVRRLRALREKTVLVVCHANSVRCLVKLLAKLDRPHANRLTVHNNVFYRVRFEGSRRSLGHFEI